MNSNYPSDLSVAEWSCIQRFLPPLSAKGGPRAHPLRRILDAIFYVLRTGCARRYLEGLLRHIEHENGWQLAEALGGDGPQGMQRLVNAADCDAGVRDELRAYVMEHLADERSGVLVIDETGFV